MAYVNGFVSFQPWLSAETLRGPLTSLTVYISRDNQRFFRTGEISWNKDTSMKVSSATHVGKKDLAGENFGNLKWKI